MASIMAFGGTVLFFAGAQDQNTLEVERMILETALEKLPNDAKVLAEDHAWWDESVDNIILSENLSWLDTTVGDTVRGSSTLDGVYILRPDNSVMYDVSVAENPVRVTAFLASGVARAIASLEAIDKDIGVSKSGYIYTDGQLYAIAISMVQPSGHTVYDPPLGKARRPVVMFYQEVTHDVQMKIAQSINLNNLGFSRENTGLDSSLTLPDINGIPVGYYTWQSAQPGSLLLKKMLWPAGVFLLIVLFATLHFVHRARTLIENLTQADQAKMSFLASMSHEVRTPLNAILGFAEMISLELYGKVEGEKNKEYLDIIRRSGEHLLTIINDILDISKLESGRFEIFAETLNPADVINECLRLIEMPANDKSIQILPSFTPAKIKSDERIIRQVLINIFSNAVKFTQKNGTISILGEQFAGGYLITVTDTGIGMTASQIKEALEPFGQIRQIDEQSLRGTGLGLPLVDRFMRLLGGQMMIRSAPGYGTTVSLVFPVLSEAKHPQSRNLIMPFDT